MWGGHKTLWHDPLILGYQNRPRESCVALSWLLYTSSQKRNTLRYPPPLIWSSHKALITARKCQHFEVHNYYFYCVRTGQVFQGAGQREELMLSLWWGCVCLVDGAKWWFLVITPICGESRHPAAVLQWTCRGLLGWKSDPSPLSQNITVYVSDSGQKTLELP